MIIFDLNCPQPVFMSCSAECTDTTEQQPTYNIQLPVAAARDAHTRHFQVHWMAAHTLYGGMPTRMKNFVLLKYAWASLYLLDLLRKKFCTVNQCAKVTFSQ